MNLGTKPFLRGHFHQAAFFIALGACSLLVVKSQQSSSFWATMIYSISLVSLLGISALYHRINWQPSTRMMMRRLDHAAIYFLIAGTMTPLSLLCLSQSSSQRLLVIAWSVAGIGILLSVLFTRKPKWLNAMLCVGAAIVIVPYLSEMAHRLGSRNLLLAVIGASAYAAGAIAYALKRPNLFPTVFGYHEVFHILVVVGAGSHFMVIHSLV
jgi:hemolysin III